MLELTFTNIYVCMHIYMCVCVLLGTNHSQMLHGLITKSFMNICIDLTSMIMIQCIHLKGDRVVGYAGGVVGDGGGGGCFYNTTCTILPFTCYPSWKLLVLHFEDSRSSPISRKTRKIKNKTKRRIKVISHKITEHGHKSATDIALCTRQWQLQVQDIYQSMNSQRNSASYPHGWGFGRLLCAI